MGNQELVSTNRSSAAEGAVDTDATLWPLSAQVRDSEYALNCVTTVGFNKALGDLLASDITRAGMGLREFIERLETRGLKTLLFEESYSVMRPLDMSVADLTHLSESELATIEYRWETAKEIHLYAYAPRDLQEILDRNRQILEAHDVPTQAADFVHRVQKEVFAVKSPVFRVIAEAFNDQEMIKLYERETREPARSDPEQDSLKELLKQAIFGER